MQKNASHSILCTLSKELVIVLLVKGQLEKAMSFPLKDARRYVAPEWADWQDKTRKWPQDNR